MTVNREELVSLALGLLSAEDETRLRAALDADPALMAAYREDLETLHHLPETLPETELPPGALDRLLTRLRTEGTPPANLTISQPPAPPARRLSPAALGILALAAVAAAGLLFLRPSGPTDVLSRFRAAPGAQATALQANGAALGQLIRLPDGRAYLFLSAAPPSGRVYQLWRLQGETPVSVGVFDGHGVEWQGAEAGQTVAVSVEPPGGSEQPTTTPLLVQRI